MGLAGLFRGARRALVVGACVLSAVGASSGVAVAAPAAPDVDVVFQPGGAAIAVRQYGDEHVNGIETLAGYTVVRGADGYWAFAVRGPDGDLTASAVRVGPDGRPPRAARIEPHLRAAPTVRAGVDPWPGPLVAAPPAPNLGEAPTLVILARFGDQPSLGTTAADWSTRFFGPAGSVADYYDEASGGQLAIVPAAESHGVRDDGVVGWVGAGASHPNTGSSFTPALRSVARSALVAADASVDYARYDVRAPFGVITPDELHVAVVVAGYEAAFSRQCGNSVWGHRWALVGSEIPNLDGVTLGGGGRGGYTMFGEMHCSFATPERMATLGIIVHELGHDLSWPDLYDTKATPTHEGLGVWSVMAGGMWLAKPGQPSGSTPALPDAWSRSFQGWVTPTLVAGAASVPLGAASAGGTVAQLGANPGGVDWTFTGRSGTGEYFLVENRQRSGYDAALPGCGLLVLHVDETRPGDNTANQDVARKLVDVEEADGLGQLDARVNRGDAGDLWPGSANRTTFGPTTTPGSAWYDGGASDASLQTTGGCASTMTPVLRGPGAPGPVGPHVFSRFDGHDWEIWWRDDDGTSVRLSDNDADDTEPTLAPDGHRVAFTSDREGSDDIFTIGIDGTDLVRVTRDPADEAGAAWSPSGARIAFSSDRYGNADIFSVPATGSGLAVRLTDSAADDHDPVFAPDGDRIAFTSDRSGRDQVHTMTANGGGTARVTQDPGSARDPAWSPDGGSILFASSRHDADPSGCATRCAHELYSIGVDGDSEVRLTTDGADDRHPVPSAQGTSIVFASDRAAAPALFAMRASPGAPAAPIAAAPAPERDPAVAPLPPPAAVDFTARFEERDRATIEAAAAWYGVAAADLGRLGVEALRFIRSLAGDPPPAAVEPPPADVGPVALTASYPVAQVAAVEDMAGWLGLTGDQAHTAAAYFAAFVYLLSV